VALSPDEDPGLVAFADPRTQRALESMLSSRVGDVGVQAFERVYARTAGTEAPAGSGTAVKPVPSAYHKAMFERLVEIEALPERALRELATRRADAIIEALVKAGAERTRLAPGGVSEVDPPNDTIPARLALEAAGSTRAQAREDL
jgi:hypothetical protein